MRVAALGKPKSAEHAANILAHNWHGPKPEYKGIRFRSSYEVRVAKALDAYGIAWEYEPKRFNLGTCSYLPDFYLPGLGVYWEVKGYFGRESQKKIELFRSMHPETPLVVATESIIAMMENTALNREQFGNAMKLTEPPHNAGAGGKLLWLPEHGRSSRSSLNGVNCGNPTGERPRESAAKPGRNARKVQRLEAVAQTGRPFHERAASRMG